MSFGDIFPQSYGYVVIVGLSSYALNFYFGMKVGLARRKYKVEYPDMYSKDSKIFNCIQRVHQNYLENIPYFLTLLFLAGFQCPKWAAGLGLGFLISRVIYSKGYSTGQPDNRKWGAVGNYLFLVGLFVQSAMLAYRLL